MNIDELLNMMEEMLEEATGLPFAGGKRVVDADRMQDIIDEVHDATIEDSVKFAREIAAKEGILVGISTGANIWAAVEEAKKPENEGKLIVAVVADFGERYVSTLLFDDLRD